MWHILYNETRLFVMIKAAISGLIMAAYRAGNYILQLWFLSFFFFLSFFALA